MHRQTPSTAGFVGYSSGGARALIDEIDDSKLMQQMKGSMMGEGRESVEAPQNYGFSSVVRPATKGKDGKIEDCAEGFMSYFGGNRSSNFCAIMDDRRYRPLGLKPGENCQYDDVGQMTLLRRTGLYLLTNDNEEENSQQGGGGGASAGTHATQQQKPERMVSLRHVEKKKQDRPKRGSGAQSGEGGADGGGGASAGTLAESGGSGGQKQDYKHEGETVNTEIRATKKDIQILDGETVVARYEKSTGTWTFTSKNITLTASDHMTLKCSNGPCDIWGKPINFNGGGPSTTPFTVPG
jgi:phage gp45-like